MIRIATSLALMLSLLLFSSCGTMVKGIANKQLTEEKGAIPPELGKEKSIMLFITHHNSYNKYLKKNVKKLYTGNYEFVSKGRFKKEDKYKDLDKYRFLFDYSDNPAGTVWENKTMQAGNNNITTTKVRPALYSVKKFAIVDRKEEKIYVSNMTSSFWSKLQKVYLKKMSEKIIAEKALARKNTRLQTAML